MNTPTGATPIGNQVKNPGDTVVFSTLAIGTGPFAYQWNYNGTPLSGQTSNSLTLPSITLASAGTYSVAVNGYCNGVTNSATLTVNTNTTTTLIRGGNQALCPGNSATPGCGDCRPAPDRSPLSGA